MPNKVSMSSPGVGKPQMEDRARGESAARKRRLPTPANTRLQGSGNARSQGSQQARKGPPVSVQRNRPLSKAAVRESMGRLRSEAATRPARLLRIASSGLDAEKPAIQRVLRETGGNANQNTQP